MKKTLTSISTIILFISIFSSCSVKTNQVVDFKPDTVSLIRNPAMGWGIYVDNYTRDNDLFWSQLGDSPEKYCTFLYFRVLWSYMEPEEGKYAWEYDENYKKIISEAKRRGLKLHFRVFYDSQDMKVQATPDYVKKAGAGGYMSNTGYWSPYYDDKVFQQKLAQFIQAFAKEYDDPAVVDCVDAFNIGWWGEGHHVRLKNDNNYASVATWITHTYGTAFEKILPVINYHREITEPVLDSIVKNEDFILRHDAFGSQWYGDFEQKYAQKSFPRSAILAESCYWFVNTDKGEKINENGIDDTERWRNDEHRNMKKWRDVYIATYENARDAHANTLDLREYREVRSWLREAPDIVQKFIINGGYRFTPVQISYPSEIAQNTLFHIKHSWINSGFGVLPNNNKRWRYKYKPAFALIDPQTTTITLLHTDFNAEPSDWLKGRAYTYTCSAYTKEGVIPGKYKLAIAIIDTTIGKPGIKLSIDGSTTIDQWTIVGDLTIGDRN